MKRVLILLTALVLLLGVALPIIAQDEPGSIVDIASANEDFSTLVLALQASGLMETLAGEGPFTVFAPTNDAIASALEAMGLSPTDLLADTETLTGILMYHVVGGAVGSETVVALDGQSVPTLEGESINISVVDGGVVLNDAVNVVTVDVEASNGVIHVIDSVLVPPSVAEAMASTEASDASSEEGDEAAEAEATEEASEETDDSGDSAEGEEADDSGEGEETSEEAAEEEPVEEEVEEPGTILQVAMASDDLNTLVAAVLSAGLTDTLNGEGTYTVFAPTDEAFGAALDALGISPSDLLRDTETLTTILSYHVSPAQLDAATIGTLDGQGIGTLLGPGRNNAVVISVDDEGNINLNDSVGVVTADIAASNGTVHVIDGVLVPQVVIDAMTAADAEADTGEEATDETDDAGDEVDETGEETDESGDSEEAEATEASDEGTDAEADTGEGASDETEDSDEATEESDESGEEATGETDDSSDSEETEGTDDSGEGEEADDTGEGEETSEEPAEEEPVEEEVEEPGNIVEVAMGNEDLTTLVAAVEAAGLVDTLAEGGSFTVFAPTNDAIAAALESLGLTAEELLADTETLTTILSYHVSPAQLDAATIGTLDGQGIGTLLGPGRNNAVVISVDDEGNISLNDSVGVVTADIAASNGTVHVIDGVLVPQVVVDAMTAADVGTDEAADETDDAGDEDAEATDESEETDESGDGEEAEATEASDEGTDAEADTGEGASDETDDSGDSAEGEEADESGEGEGTSEEPTEEEPVEEEVEEPGTILQVAMASDDLNTLVAAVLSAGLTDTLNGEGTYTVFAPTDEAFGAALDALGISPSDLLRDTETLTTILSYHVSPAQLDALTIGTLDGQGIGTLLGPGRNNAVVVSVDDEGNISLNDSVGVVTADIAASNGTVHVIDGVLVPQVILDAMTAADAGDAGDEAAEATDDNGEGEASDESEEAESTDEATEETDESAETADESEEAESTDEESDETTEETDASTDETSDEASDETGDSGDSAEGEEADESGEGEGTSEEPTEEEPVEEEVEEPGTILQVAMASDDLNTLVAAVLSAGLTDTLNGEGTYTVFAPTDEAFGAALDALGISPSDLLRDTETLTTILSYHVSPAQLDAATIGTLDGQGIGTLLGPGRNNAIVISVDDEGNINLNDSVSVVAADIAASNGTVHVIDGVLVPQVVIDAMTAADAEADTGEEAADETDDAGDEADETSEETEGTDESEEGEEADESGEGEETSEEPAEEEPVEEEVEEPGNIVEVVMGNEDLTTLVAAVEAAGLVDTLAEGGPFTVFAPTNDAIAAALESLGLTAEELLADTETLTTVLSYHVSPAQLDAATIGTLDGQGIGTLLGPGRNNAVVISVDDEGNISLNDSVSVVAADIAASNGTVHVIDGVLVPQVVIDAMTAADAGDAGDEAAEATEATEEASEETDESGDGEEAEATDETADATDDTEATDEATDGGDGAEEPPAPEATEEPVAEEPPAPEATEEPVVEEEVGVALVRVAHFSPDAGPVDIYVDGELAIQNATFPTIIEFLPISAGSHDFAVVPAGATIDQAAIGPVTVDLVEDSWTTIAAHGTVANNSLTASVIPEDLSPLPDGVARVVVFHGIDDAPRVDVLADGGLLIAFLGYPGSITYTDGTTNDGVISVDVLAGTYDLDIVETGTVSPVLIDLGSPTLESGTSYFIAAIGTLDALAAAIDPTPLSEITE